MGKQYDVILFKILHDILTAKAKYGNICRTQMATPKMLDTGFRWTFMKIMILLYFIIICVNILETQPIGDEYQRGEDNMCFLGR